MPAGRQPGPRAASIESAERSPAALGCAAWRCERVKLAATESGRAARAGGRTNVARAVRSAELRRRCLPDETDSGSSLRSGLAVPDLLSCAPTVAQRIDQQGERRCGLPAARVIEVVA